MVWSLYQGSWAGISLFLGVIVCSTLLSTSNEGTAPAIVSWALSREIRQMVQIAHAAKDGFSMSKLFTDFRIWDKRKPLVSSGLKRLSLTQWQSLLQQCLEADMALKGQSREDCWLLFENIVIQMSGKNPLKHTA